MYVTFYDHVIIMLDFSEKKLFCCLDRSHNVFGIILVPKLAPRSLQILLSTKEVSQVFAYLHYFMEIGKQSIACNIFIIVLLSHFEHMYCLVHVNKTD